jgi:hypothetical protein
VRVESDFRGAPCSPRQQAEHRRQRHPDLAGELHLCDVTQLLHCTLRHCGTATLPLTRSVPRECFRLLLLLLLLFNSRPPDIERRSSHAGANF